MGAWIETPLWIIHLPSRQVAPLMGAWIETKIMAVEGLGFVSRTSHGCVD